MIKRNIKENLINVNDYLENMDFDQIGKDTQFFINNLLYEKSKQANQLSIYRKNQASLQINLNLKLKEIKETKV